MFWSRVGHHIFKVGLHRRLVVHWLLRRRHSLLHQEIGIKLAGLLHTKRSGLKKLVSLLDIRCGKNIAIRLHAMLINVTDLCSYSDTLSWAVLKRRSYTQILIFKHLHE